MVKKPIKYKKKRFNLDTMTPRTIKPCLKCNGNMVRKSIGTTQYWLCTRCHNGADY